MHLFFRWKRCGPFAVATGGRQPSSRLRCCGRAGVCMGSLLLDRRSLRLFRVCLSVALLLEQLDLLLTGDLYAWIIDGGGVLDRPAC